MPIDYKEFISEKVKRNEPSGFTSENLNENLKGFQQYITKVACEYGKFAVFAECGLGKTLIQLEWAYHVTKQTNKPVLILCPLAVKYQTVQEAEKFGIDISMIDVNNYDQIDNIDCSKYAGVVIDESSILKNFEGKFRNRIIQEFQNTPYKLACTATPSPNDEMEIGNHAEFLGVMKRNEMLSKFFVHDGGNTSQWRLKYHAEKEFYAWMSSWAIMLNKPSDIGFSDEGYILPELKYNTETIQTEKQDNGMLFNDTHVNATGFNKELKKTMAERMEKAADIVNKDNEQYIVWVNQNAEADYFKELVSDAVDVRGNTKDKEGKLLGFANGDFRVLLTKRKIAQFGLNFQNCFNQIHASLDFSFEGLYQAVRRSYRFGQTRPVNVHIITTDTMSNVLKSIYEKEEKFKTMKEKMNTAMNYNEESDHKFNDKKGDGYHLMNGDAVERMKEVENESVGLSIFSPPFAQLYTYSDYPEDMGNCNDYQEFVDHFKYLVSELYRVTEQGRNVCIHCMDLPVQKGREGYIGLRDFSGIIREAMEAVGFIYHSRITIWKNPVTEMQRTKALGLLHKQTQKDSTMSRVGIPDYILVFRKDGERKNPVQKNDLSVDYWQKIASPVWMDIDYGDTLNYKAGKHEKDEKHICPMQLPTIERLIYLYSNEGDTVLDPFNGVGSVSYEALKTRRKAVGIELKPSYFEQSVKNTEKALLEKQQLTLV